MKPSQVNWRAVVFYYVIACAISWPFFWWRDYTRVGYLPWFTYIIMWGPGVAAIISLFVFRASHQRTVALFGTSVRCSIAMYVVPLVIAVPIIGLGNAAPGATMENLARVFAQSAIFGLLLTIGEELGWRGFLQDALRALTPWRRYVLIGVLWACWHFTNNFHHQSAQLVILKAAIYVPACIAISWFAGQMMDRTRSLLVACCVHAWVNISFEMTEEFGYRTLIATAITLVFWWGMLRRWPGADAHAKVHLFTVEKIRLEAKV